MCTHTDTHRHTSEERHYLLTLVILDNQGLHLLLLLLLLVVPVNVVVKGTTGWMGYTV
jgi:hypothetical protein